MPVKGNSTVLFEHSFYIGSYMGGIMYGFEITIYFMIIRALFRRGNKNSSRSRRFSAIYSTVMVLLNTIDVSTNAFWGEDMWITYRDKPGGVSQFITTEVSVWYETWGSAAVVGSVFLGDALLIYRLFLVYGRRSVVVVFPIIAYIAGLVLAIQQLVVAGKPDGDFFGLDSIKFAVSYYSITITLNIVLTVFICMRLSTMSKWFTNTLGKENGKVYSTAAAMLVESAAPYSILGLMYLIPFSRQDGIGILFGQLWSKMSGIAPLLIILRVVNGRAWSDDKTEHIRTPLTFRKDDDFVLANAVPAPANSNDPSPPPVPAQLQIPPEIP
ncbi:hypothetical protein CPC08DRAFT_634288 [Agrocybe pediades]|nr:hypothetical protein CPC08DRAFT_634288 [Agrocybe pediades]